MRVIRLKIESPSIQESLRQMNEAFRNVATCVHLFDLTNIACSRLLDSRERAKKRANKEKVPLIFRSPSII